MDTIILSPSKLNDLVGKDGCPRCFYLRYKPVEEFPKGLRAADRIFPGLPSGVDSMMKNYHDNGPAYKPLETPGYRAKRVLPPYLIGKIPGILYPDGKRLAQLQNYRNLFYKERYRDINVVLQGGIDDLILRDDGRYSTADFKTKGREPEDDGSQYYQNQLNCYQLMLGFQGFVMDPTAFLIYLWPAQAVGPETPMAPSLSLSLNCKVYSIKASEETAKKSLHRAVDLLLTDDLPESGPTCDLCRYHRDYADRMKLFDGTQSFTVQ